MADDAGGRSPSASGAAPGGWLRVRTEPHPGGRVLVMHLEGEIDTATAGRFREQAVSAALSLCPPRLVLDLDRVTFCDASGLGALVALRNAVGEVDGRLAIARAPEMCRRILHRTGLDQYIPVTATLDAAVALLTGRTC